MMQKVGEELRVKDVTVFATSSTRSAGSHIISPLLRLSLSVGGVYRTRR